jgi:hypothetical protein
MRKVALSNRRLARASFCPFCGVASLEREGTKDNSAPDFSCRTCGISFKLSTVNAGNLAGEG